MERNLSKRRIIELYLNVAEWGDGIFGIEAAARCYFGKGAADLTAKGSAQLAVVLPSPLRYHPGRGGRYVESRAEVIYRIMVRRGIVIPEYEDMLNEPVSAGAGTKGERSGQAPTDSSGNSSAMEGQGSGKTLPATATPMKSGAQEGEAW